MKPADLGPAQGVGKLGIPVDEVGEAESVVQSEQGRAASPAQVSTDQDDLLPRQRQRRCQVCRDRALVFPARAGDKEQVASPPGGHLQHACPQVAVGLGNWRSWVANHDQVIAEGASLATTEGWDLRQDRSLRLGLEVEGTAHAIVQHVTDQRQPDSQGQAEDQADSNDQRTVRTYRGGG